MRITIMQPAYLPWQGYFQRVLLSDVCVSLDDVKIDWHSKTQFTNRNKILSHHGEVLLTIPLLDSGSSNMIINQISICNQQDWNKKHWKTILQAYSRAPFWKEHNEFMQCFFQKSYTRLVDAINASTQYFLAELKNTTKIIQSSDLKVPGEKSLLILNICKELGATQYISGPFGRQYLDRKEFEAAGIEVLFHDFIPFAYPQPSRDFVPYLSVLDLLMSVGAAESRKLLETSEVGLHAE